MNKSQFLDELRMEVGLVGDYASDLREFYGGIVKAVGNCLHKKSAVALYKTDNFQFQLFTSAGDIHENESEKFGEGPLSLCAIRSRPIILPKDNYNRLFTPFYEGHHLKGIFFIECHCNEYKFTNDDVIFLDEVSRYIESNHQRYKGFQEKYKK
ncbi:hypothetical protein ACJ2A9_09310 [Anaerobacillus sp. MEB173]|uniref:hypothetical protein n=1 Tax=Anaerobacillus sp. MEB173 TaxID=3383345 RepID=UPI003F9312C9